MTLILPPMDLTELRETIEWLRSEAKGPPHSVPMLAHMTVLDRTYAELKQLRTALEPFAKCAPEDESEVDFLVSKTGAVADARRAFGPFITPSSDKQ